VGLATQMLWNDKVYYVIGCNFLSIHLRICVQGWPSSKPLAIVNNRCPVAKKDE
jgi:hypothetical protein